MLGERDFPDPRARGGVSPVPSDSIAMAVVWRGPDVLLLQRPDPVSGSRWWQFPSARIAAGESSEAALRRELRAELGVEVQSLEPLGREIYVDEAGTEVETRFVRCDLASFEFKPGAGSQTWRWVKPDEVDPKTLAPRIRSYLPALSSHC